MSKMVPGTIFAGRNDLDRTAWYDGGYLLTFLATGEETEGRYSLIEAVSRKGLAANPPLHVHHREEEAYYVVEGEVTFLIGDDKLHATAGSFIVLPRDIPHTWIIESENVRLLILCTPAGFEGFFRELSRPTSDRSLPLESPGPPDVEKMGAAAGRYGVEILGPPPA